VALKTAGVDGRVVLRIGATDSSSASERAVRIDAHSRAARYQIGDQIVVGETERFLI